MESIKKQRKTVIYLIVILVIIILLNLLLLIFPGNKVKSGNKENNATNTQSEFYSPSFLKNGNLTRVEMFLPAIDSQGNGVMTKLSVEAMKGSGRTLIDVDNLLFFADTQQSIRVARLVAQDKTGKNLSNYDFIYSIQANASVIGGPSAGATLAIATIASLTGEKPRNDTMITGVINRDGSIGPVSDILQKVNVSRIFGVKVFLVPLLQSREVVYETEKYCEKFGMSEVCSTETKPKRVNVSEQTGIKIVEVESIGEAMKYFF
jgi:uncharacterized protein